jgi:hypothetical protein
MEVNNMTKTRNITSKNKHSYLIEVTPANPNKETFRIPVVDVRDGEDARELASKLTRSSNGFRGSKFMKPSYAYMGGSYNVSYKQK